MKKTNNEEARLQTILECSNIGTWEWNVQTGETVFNEIWAQIVGYTLDELAPASIKTWERIAHPDDLKASEKLLERHFSGELPYYDFKSRMKHKDGHWVWVHDRGKVISWSDDGKPLVMLGSHEDVTEVIKNKKSLAQIQWMLSEKAGQKENVAPEYGDLTELNKNGLILSSLGKELLMQITSEYLDLADNEKKIKTKIKKALADLDKKVIERYKTLTEDEIKQLVVDDKWMAVLERNVKTEMERISQRLAQRIKELAERYETPLPKQTSDVTDLEGKVNTHLQKMGFVWK